MIKEDNGEIKGFLTISVGKDGIRKMQLEVQLPFSEEEIRFLLQHCKGHLIIKRRHEVENQGRKWEIDVFEELNAGLIVAEIELLNENEKIELPYWVSQEVTLDERYKNHYLAQNPYQYWKVK